LTLIIYNYGEAKIASGYQLSADVTKPNYYDDEKLNED